MLLLKLIAALVIIVVALIVVFRYQRQVKGTGSSIDLGSRGKRDGGSNQAELEEFIAAYRRDKGTSGTAVPATPEALAGAEHKARAAFLSGAEKLAYLLLKSGLPDHHVFARTPLRELVEGMMPGGVASEHVDFVVCDQNFAIVAVIVVRESTPLTEAARQQLQAAGIRCAQFKRGAFPKPAEVRRAVYEE